MTKEDKMKEWEGMPEFHQEDLTSKRKIIVHFRCQEDVDKFEQLMDQKITPKQKSLWFPHMPHRKAAHLRYVDES